ncbi:MAG TPA: 4'-phosphopantetheinyl transferase superfamily protein [Acidimicrobiales bacterium]
MAFNHSGIRVGVDLVCISEVEHSIEMFGDRYTHRLFSDHERASCVGTPRTVAEGLAARFAAKEAAIKVLRPTGASGLWRSIEVVRSESGACDLLLTGEAARLAEAAGIDAVAVSLAHEHDQAVAVVVATFRDEIDHDVPRDATP